MLKLLRTNLTLEKSIVKIITLIKASSRPILVAVDGRSGAGKSTVARIIAKRAGGVAITADDFWVGGSNETWDGRTPKERAEMAIDWRRIRAEVLTPLLAGKSATWHPFDWKKGFGQAEISCSSLPAPLVVLDGAYSMRPELRDIIDFSILVEVCSDKERRKRLIIRESEAYMKDWHKRWDPAEDYYFSQVSPRESFDAVILNR